jgi:hypothetical protein
MGLNVPFGHLYSYMPSVAGRFLSRGFTSSMSFNHPSYVPGAVTVLEAL